MKTETLNRAKEIQSELRQLRSMKECTEAGEIGISVGNAIIDNWGGVSAEFKDYLNDLAKVITLAKVNEHIAKLEEEFESL